MALSALYQESGKLQLPEVLLRLTIYIQDPVDRRRQPNSLPTQNTNTTTRHERREALETGEVQNARHLHRWPFWPPARPLTSLQINMVYILLLWRAYNRGQCRGSIIDASIMFIGLIYLGRLFTEHLDGSMVCVWAVRGTTA